MDTNHLPMQKWLRRPMHKLRCGYRTGFAGKAFGFPAGITCRVSSLHKMIFNRKDVSYENVSFNASCGRKSPAAL